jgi:uncharacterized membrane protein (UPF0127 family)
LRDLRHADGSVVCERCGIADNFFSRMRGLLGRRQLPDDECLLIRPAGSIHTFFMRFPIDALFLDRELRVLAVSSDLKPWRVAGQRGARVVVEMAAGQASKRGVQVGEQLALGEARTPDDA